MEAMLCRHGHPWRPERLEELFDVPGGGVLTISVDHFRAADAALAVAEAPTPGPGQAYLAVLHSSVAPEGRCEECGTRVVEAWVHSGRR